MINDKSLKSLGISAKIATIFIGVGVLANIYSKYYELKRNKLEIKLLKNELKEKNLL